MDVVTNGNVTADAVTTPPGDADRAAASAAAAGDSGSAAETPSALETFLAEETNRAAYDAAVADAVAAALEAQKAEEAEKARKAKLTADERVAEKEQELADREAKLQAAELRNAAVEAFGAAGIPTKLAECLNYSTKATYEQSFAAVKMVFQEAVEAAVNVRLRGRVPVAAGSAAEQALIGKAAAADNDFAALIHDNQARR